MVCRAISAAVLPLRKEESRAQDEKDCPGRYGSHVGGMSRARRGSMIALVEVSCCGESILGTLLLLLAWQSLCRVADDGVVASDAGAATAERNDHRIRFRDQCRVIRME